MIEQGELSTEQYIDKLTKFFPPDHIDEDIHIQAGVAKGLEKAYWKNLDPRLKQRLLDQEEFVKLLIWLRDKYKYLGKYQPTSGIIT